MEHEQTSKTPPPPPADRPPSEDQAAPARGSDEAGHPPLRAEDIEHGLKVTRVGRSVVCFEDVESTNDVAWGALQQKGPNSDGLVVSAERQRRGRGRQGRTWWSPVGENLLLSVLLHDHDNCLSRDALTIAAGLATAEAIHEAAELRAELKWPNDVLLDGRKVAGVLVEARFTRGLPHMVVGIGVNVHSHPPDRQTRYGATSLAEQASPPPTRLAVARALLEHLDLWVAAVAAGRLDDLHDAWLGRCGMIGQRVEALCAGKTYTGRVLDVSPLEGLILVDDAGGHVALPARTTTIV